MSYGALSSLSASSVPTATALPCMSSCMWYMLLCDLRLMPPVSKQMPLPTSASRRALAPLRARAIAQAHDAGVAMFIGARDGEECAGASSGAMRASSRNDELPARAGAPGRAVRAGSRSS